MLLHELFVFKLNLKFSLLFLDVIKSLFGVLLNVLVLMNNFELKFLVFLGESLVLLTQIVELSVDFLALLGFALLIFGLSNKLLEDSTLLEEIFHLLDFLGVDNLDLSLSAIITA